MSTQPTPTPAQAIPDALARALPGGRTERALQVERAAVDTVARTATLAFASEYPYERSWGVEILDCTATAMRQGRLRAGANLLCDHDARDVVGVIESVEIGPDRVGRAVVRFGKSARADEVFTDVVDGIRRNVSVGYLIHQAQLVEQRDGLDTYRVTDWEPYEISLVSIPADPTVGLGRSHQPVDASAPAPATPQTAAPAAITQPETITMTDPVITTAERNHAAEISNIAKGLPNGAELALSAIQRGLTVEQFQREALAAISSKPLPTADIGMDAKEVRRYSMLNVINALCNPNDANAQRAAAFEREAGEAAARKQGRVSRGFVVPYDVQRRDLVVGTASAGGNLVGTDILGNSFIEVLRNAMVLPGLGARMLTGLQGNVAIPKQTAAATAYWVAENAAPTEGAPTFGQVTMTPKTVAAYVDVGRTLSLQSSIDVEGLIQRDLAEQLARFIEQAAIYGTGLSNQPSGILTQVTPSVVGGTDGAAPTWAHIIELESDVAVANAAVGSLAYLTNAKVRGKLKGTSKVSGQNGFVWEAGDTPLNGYRAAVSNAVPSNLTKGSASGVASAIIYGNWADLIIGMWGGLELTSDPYSLSTTGATRVVALQDVDVALRNTVSFATMADALTA